jgi:outer membrane immunogenic protein
MKRILPAVAALATGLPVALSASAASKLNVGGISVSPYVGVDGGVHFSHTDPREDLTLSTVGGRIGLEFNDMIGLEARAGWGVGSDDLSANGRKYDVDLPRYVGGYVKLQTPAFAGFRAHALAGVAGVRMTKESGAGIHIADRNESFSYGAGVSYQLPANLRVGAEYMVYHEDIDSVNGFLNMHF